MNPSERERGRSDSDLLQNLLDTAIDAADTAVGIIRDAGSRSAVGTKSTTTDIVTATDIAAEAAIIETLTTSTPGSRLYGEESGFVALGTGPYGSIEWIVDPLDGTVNFSYGIPIVAVSIAAAIDGVISVGVVYDGSGTHRFTATLGGGAQLNDDPIVVSGCDDSSAALVVTGFAYDAERRRRHADRVAALIANVRDVRAFGSAALHLCAVAAGHVDCYVERHIKPWDWAAGSLICTEAGATVELPCPENDDLVIAATPGVFETVRSYF